MLHFAKSLRKIVTLVALLSVFLIFGTVSAAEFAEGEVYRLMAGETVGDDLYVFGREIIIDGTVEGDVIAFGGYIEINGVVAGDLFGAGAGIVINGEVQDDVRVAGAGITIAGNVGDDILATGGGGLPGMPIGVGNRSVTPGIRVLQGAQVGGDLIIAGDRGVIAGQIADDLFTGMNFLDFNAQVGGDAQIHARTLIVGSAAQVDGTMSYSTASKEPVSSDVATNVVALPWTESAEAKEVRTGGDWAWQIGWWLARTLLVALGLSLTGWLLLNFAPVTLEGPAATLAAKPAESGIAGVIAAALSIPTVAALTFLGGLFWGPFPGAVAMFAFLFGVLTLLWLLSPLVTGLWLGRKVLAVLNRELGTLATMLIGALTIVVIGRSLALIPCAGEVAYRLLYLLSFAFALGAGLLAWLSPPKEAVALDTAASDTAAPATVQEAVPSDTVTSPDEAASDEAVSDEAASDVETSSDSGG